MTLPILYSFRRCPYAIRARLALAHCGAQYEHREIVLKNKPVHMLELSSKGTVPVFVLADESNASNVAANYRVLDESIDIMYWAMTENPSRHIANAKAWSITETMGVDEIKQLIRQNDVEFKDHLDKYKYSDRHPEHPQVYYFDQAMPFLQTLERILSNSPYLGGRQFRFADAAILPFIRQFSMVDSKQFASLPMPKLQQWLAEGLKSDLFVSVMHKIPLWSAESGDGLVVHAKE